MLGISDHMNMSESNSRHWGRQWWIAGLGVLLYFLSVGPAARLLYSSKTSPASARTFEIIYAPVIWLQGHSVWGGFLIYRYVDAWGGIDYR